MSLLCVYPSLFNGCCSFKGYRESVNNDKSDVIEICGYDLRKTLQYFVTDCDFSNGFDELSNFFDGVSCGTQVEMSGVFPTCMGEDKLLYVVKLNKFPNILPFPRMLNNTNEILIVIYKRD